MSLAFKSFSACLADSADVSGSSARISRRVLVNADLLKSAKILAGDVLAVTSIKHEKDTPFAIGVAWPSPDVPAEVVYLSASHLLSASLQEQEKVKIIPLSDKSLPDGFPSLKNLQFALFIAVTEYSEKDECPKLRRQEKKETKKPDWLTLYIREILVDLKYVYLGQKIQLSYEGQERMFIITTISASSGQSEGLTVAMDALSVRDTRPVLWTAGWDSQVSIAVPSAKEQRQAKTGSSSATLEDSNAALEGYASVGGLEAQITQIRDLIEVPLTRPELFRHFGLKPPKGILLYGPPGTGKTHLARAVVAATRHALSVSHHHHPSAPASTSKIHSTDVSFFSIAGAELASAYHGETEARLRSLFADARARVPSIVLLDEVDALAPRREASATGDGGGGGGGEGGGGEVEKRVVATLLTIMDGVGEDGEGGGDERVVVIGTTNRPGAIDPALRRPGRFDREIEIGVPDAEARYAILRVLLIRAPHQVPEAELRALAARTHGYVGADLAAVVREAGTIAIKRYLHPPPSSTLPPSTADAPFASTSTSTAFSQPQVPNLHITSSDLTTGLALVQPSALRTLTTSLPPVHWADVGGLAHVAARLRECVEWPLKRPDAFKRLGVRAPRGVLLYGPPGCAKTLAVRALATESGINFLAVKGPEVLNKFVGESERAVREVFRKARMAAPSIVFFDEIDALASSRSSSGARYTEGVLTTLLTEMDGVHALVGVTIVAATNRPDAIDSALMRPGRLDRILYVGPPDRAGRIEVLKIRMHGMAAGPDVDLEEIADMTDGCSGAELTALCQDAALLTMKNDFDAPCVPREAFLQAARGVRRQITPEIVAQFERWREQSGLTSA